MATQKIIPTPRLKLHHDKQVWEFRGQTKESPQHYVQMLDFN